MNEIEQHEEVPIPPGYMWFFHALIALLGVLSLMFGDIEVSSPNQDYWKSQRHPSAWEQSRMRIKDDHATTVFEDGLYRGYEKPRSIYPEWSRPGIKHWGDGY